MGRSIAIVGGGPTAVYLVQALVSGGWRGRVVVFDRGPRIGVGMPYDPRLTDPALMANIASREIPPLGVSLAGWANALPKATRARFDMDWPMDDRSFPTRVLLGEYFAAAATRLEREGPARGVTVELRPCTPVGDIRRAAAGVFVQSEGGAAERFDDAVLATGHDWPRSDEAAAGRYLSPWHAGGVRVPPAASVAVLGSSLSAIDAAVTLAMGAGSFAVRPDGGGQDYALEPARRLSITFFSRGGVLPEADFFYIHPPAPLAICTAEAVDAEIARGPDGLLDRVFDLMRAELAAADRFHALLIGLAALGPDDFADAYFAGRRSHDPFAHARANLDETRENAARRRTVAWRLAILRMHEVVARIVPHLSDADRRRFDRGLRRLFADNYAAVPLNSVERLIALHAAGVLDVERIGPCDRFVPAAQGVTLTQGNRVRAFTTLIDARGQRRMGLGDLPFATLRAELAETACREDGPLPLDGDLLLPAAAGTGGRVFCAAIPFLMHDRPFVQGVVEAERLAATVARAITGAAVLRASA